MENRIAIIMAAGMGMRLRPLTETTPKPLLKVKGTPMVETIIDGLRQAGVGKIYVVVGYLKEQFEYLTERYPGLELIENREYRTKNNISSLYAARDVLGSADCFICEADLYISDPAVFEGAFPHSGYFGKRQSGHTDDWAFAVDESGRIRRIGLGGDDAYMMVGLSFFKKDDAAAIAAAIERACAGPGHEKLFWDEIVDRLLGDIEVRIYPVDSGKIVEIDTVQELEALAER